MVPSSARPRGLTGNQLKILALVCMTADHVGLQLLPQVPFLRLIGRLAFPIYGWMIAEGCRHTHDRKGYLLRLAGLAAVPVLALYNGNRGKYRIGRLFYWYYPGHLVAIYGISLMISLF